MRARTEAFLANRRSYDALLMSAKNLRRSGSQQLDEAIIGLSDRGCISSLLKMSAVLVCTRREASEAFRGVRGTGRGASLADGLTKLFLSLLLEVSNIRQTNSRVAPSCCH